MISLSAFGQSTTNGLPPLLPPYVEIRPSFWEQHSTAIIIASIMFLAAMGLVLWILLRPRTTAALPPGVVARAKLAKLINQPETGIELNKVSQILREYMIAAFDLSPGEFTTAEFCSMLVQNEKIGPESAQLISNFLHECDQRKFAPGQGSSPMNAVNRAAEIVSNTEEQRKQFTVKK